MRNFLIITIAILLAACSAHKGKKLQKAGYVVPGNKEVSIGTSAQSSITFNYFQCGGFRINVGNESLLIDPFFSNPPLTGKATIKGALIDEVFKGSDSAAVKGILVTHSHYDHLMDVPYIAGRHCNPQTKVLTNATGVSSIKHMVKDTLSLVNVETATGFIKLSPTFTVLPLVTTHPPHIGGLHLYDGEFNPRKNPFAKGYWRCGKPYAYLIDVMGGNSVALRILVQTSSSLEALKNIPDNVLAAKAVDIAILPAALFSKVKGYPTAVLTRLNPKYTIVCHWENFFKPYNKLTKKPYTVASTNVVKFAKTVEAGVGKDKFRIPMPGSRVRVEY